ncbi:MAG: hypothetical protein Q7T69_19320 [Rhodoferax sp.]|nr:hypothetical protein [Rhodoferax sp.]
MQIDRYNHLLFPRDSSNPATSGKQPAPAAIAPAQTKPQVAGDSARDGESARSGSVVLKIQVPDSVADAAVYSRGRKAGATEDQDSDAQGKAQNHQQALDRNAGVFTQITLNKDGVLVARPQPAASAREPDFVALAVSAMREFSDEHERQKVRSADAQVAPAPNPTPADTPWTALKGLQQFAAKLNVFA